MDRVAVLLCAAALAVSLTALGAASCSKRAAPEMREPEMAIVRDAPGERVTIVDDDAVEAARSAE